MRVCFDVKYIRKYYSVYTEEHMCAPLLNVDNIIKFQDEKYSEGFSKLSNWPEHDGRYAPAHHNCMHLPTTANSLFANTYLAFNHNSDSDSDGKVKEKFCHLLVNKIDTKNRAKHISTFYLKGLSHPVNKYEISILDFHSMSMVSTVCQ